MDQYKSYFSKKDIYQNAPGMSLGQTTIPNNVYPNQNLNKESKEIVTQDSNKGIIGTIVGLVLIILFLGGKK